MKKNKWIIWIPIAVLLFGIVVAQFVVPWLFSSQYNSNGVSHFLVVTIDKEQEREFVGKLDRYFVYVEGLKIDEVNFRNVSAENVPIREAIMKNLVSVDEWKKYAWTRKKEGDSEILRFDNYEMVIAYDDCIIRPISR